MIKLSTQVSPSLSMEKGAYRIRAPSRPSKLRNEIKSRSYTPSQDHLGAMILLLLLSTLGCFGAAYYLLQMRWEVEPLQISSDERDALQVHAVNVNSYPPINLDVNPDEKYLSYLPHSGFHNQRIALENAIVLSITLNRTLLMPPTIVGEPTGYAPFQRLKRYLSKLNEPQEPGSNHHSLVSWHTFFNLSFSSSPRIIERWDLTDQFYQDLNISSRGIYSLKDHDVYHYRFADTSSRKGIGSRYLDSVLLKNLGAVDHRLLEIGTLFGNSRLRLRQHANRDLRTSIRQQMTFSNPAVLASSEVIKTALGGQYLGVHARLGDGRFSEESHENMKQIWRKLVHGSLEYNLRDGIYGLEGNKTTETGPDRNANSTTGLETGTDRPRNTPHEKCRSPLHLDPHLAQLNTPLFIATDARRPENHPALRIFYETFPCTFTLRDFAGYLDPLDSPRNAGNGESLKGVLLPVVDAVVASKATVVVGTEGSTFSSYVEDVLWRRYHGLPIVERG